MSIRIFPFASASALEWLFLWPCIFRILSLDLGSDEAVIADSRRALSSVLVMQNSVKSTSSNLTNDFASAATSSSGISLFRTSIRKDNFLIPRHLSIIICSSANSELSWTHSRLMCFRDCSLLRQRTCRSWRLVQLPSVKSSLKFDQRLALSPTSLQSLNTDDLCSLDSEFGLRTGIVALIEVAEASAHTCRPVLHSWGRCMVGNGKYWSEALGEDSGPYLKSPPLGSSHFGSSPQLSISNWLHVQSSNKVWFSTIDA